MFTRAGLWFSIVVLSAAPPLHQARGAHPLPVERLANDTLTLPEQPPSTDFETEIAFPGLSFEDPVAIVTPPGDTTRIFVVEQDGIISVIPDVENPTKETFLNIVSRVSFNGGNDERGLLGLAFHPDWQDNGRFFVFYTTTGTLFNRLSEFSINPDNPNRAITGSERILFNQRDEAGNHNGGDLHFGRDGYLYISVGDEGGANDQYNNSQRIDKDLFAGVLRIDVDGREGNLVSNRNGGANPPYWIPADNPYVDATSFNGSPVSPNNVLTEFWAVGLRNPWRFSFDPLTGLLYLADVGQGDREEINIIVKGGNYGWSYREGTAGGPRGGEPAGVDFIDPILEYRHTGRIARFTGLSVSGGIVYRGDRIPELYGAYLFADYVSGNVWSLNYDGVEATNWQHLTTDAGISAFGADPSNGDILMADRGNDNIKRLVRAAQVPDTLPATLSETGAFADLGALTPNDGILPYEIQVPFWSDNAIKSRWFSVPSIDNQISFNDEGAPFGFPGGSVFIKHFDLQTDLRDPEATRRLETRFIVTNDDGVYGVTYKWNEDESEATLVGEEGLDEEIEIIEADGSQRTQTWRYPGRSQCIACHTTTSGGVLGFKDVQLAGMHPYDDADVDQLAHLATLGYFSNPPTDVDDHPRLHPADDDDASLSARVRSFFDSNCSQCHQPNGPAVGNWDARFSTPLHEAGIVNAEPVRNGGAGDDLIIAAGNPSLSTILNRISIRGPMQMPPLASHLIDESGVALLTEWIESLEGFEQLEQSLNEWTGETLASAPEELRALTANADGDELVNYLEYLLEKDPLDPESSWSIDIAPNETGLRIAFPGIKNTGTEIRFEKSSNPGGPWSRAGAEEIDYHSTTGETMEFEEPLPESEAVFYRARFLTP